MVKNQSLIRKLKKKLVFFSSHPTMKIKRSKKIIMSYHSILS